MRPKNKMQREDFTGESVKTFIGQESPCVQLATTEIALDSSVLSRSLFSEDLHDGQHIGWLSVFMVILSGGTMPDTSLLSVSRSGRFRYFSALQNSTAYRFAELADLLRSTTEAETNPETENKILLDHSCDNSTIGMLTSEDPAVKWSLNIRSDSTEHIFRYTYRPDSVDEATIRKYHSMIMTVAKAVSNDEGIAIGDIELITEQDRQKISSWNETVADYPSDKTMMDLFATSVDRYGKRDALISRNKKLTYQEFNEKADQVATTLIKNGVENEDIIAVMMERSFEMMITIFGILKAGAAYLPIDTAVPAERIRYILEDSGACLGITSSALLSKFEGLMKSLTIEDLLEDTTSSEPVQSRANPESLAYIIYTSGSTGRPKGVMITHQALTNRIHWMQKTYPINKNDVVLQKTPVVFDVSVWELFWWTTQGATLSLLATGGEKEPETIVETISENNVSVMHFVPSMLQVFLDHVESGGCVGRLTSLRNVFASGEALTPDQANLFNARLLRSNGTKLINLYGPTEATIDVSYFDCFGKDHHDYIPIGKPIDNTELLVLNTNMKELPVGFTGELHIAGVGLARGYRNNDALTAEKFVAHPYKKGEKIYKTGDLARWNENGQLEYLGRIDDQVKISGHRIELGEIEHLIRQVDAVNQSVVVVKERNGYKYLAAYYTTSGSVDNEAVMSLLERSLPAYMVPESMMQLDHFPVTTNGKLDRKSLPEPVVGAHTEIVMPENETESGIMGVWTKILPSASGRIGTRHDFFSIGGNSLNANQLINKLNSKFGTSFTLMEIFDKNTIKDQAEYILLEKWLKNIETSDENADQLII